MAQSTTFSLRGDGKANLSWSPDSIKAEVLGCSRGMKIKPFKLEREKRPCSVREMGSNQYLVKHTAGIITINMFGSINLCVDRRDPPEGENLVLKERPHVVFHNEQ